MTAPLFSRLLTIVLTVSLLLVVTLGGLRINAAVSATHSKGLLQVTSSANATLSVSQDERQAQIIGTGRAKVWLQPGIYELEASAGGVRAAQVVTVYARQVATAHITPTSKRIIPSVADVTFNNTDALINAGLTSTQVSVFERLIFNYKTSVQTVTIDGSSLKSGPINQTGDPRFTDTFTLQIDTKSYTATIGYSDLQSIALRLIDSQTGAQVLNVTNLAQ